MHLIEIAKSTHDGCCMYVLPTVSLVLAETGQPEAPKR